MKQYKFEILFQLKFNLIMQELSRFKTCGKVNEHKEFEQLRELCYQSLNNVYLAMTDGYYHPKEYIQPQVEDLLSNFRLLKPYVLNKPRYFIVLNTVVNLKDIIKEKIK